MIDNLKPAKIIIEFKGTSLDVNIEGKKKDLIFLLVSAAKESCGFKTMLVAAVSFFAHENNDPGLSEDILELLENDDKKEKHTCDCGCHEDDEE